MHATRTQSFIISSKEISATQKEMYYEGPETTTKGRGEWKPQISCEIFDRCPKITPSTNEFSKVKISRPTCDESKK
jgi:hypothetical protein